MGTNPDLDKAIALRTVMEEFLRQPMDELVTFEAAVAQLRESMRV
jgi:flagellar biosynthesis/type III secretory pathway ATPase